MKTNLPDHIQKRRRKGAGNIKKKRNRVPENVIQNIARINREEDYEEVSGSESDEWYEGDEHDEYAFTEGGYYRAKPGDKLGGKYVIAKRLGWGHFSQVYLAKEKGGSEWIALKVQKTGEDYIKAGEEEVSFHEAINKIEVEDTHICRMQENFEIYSDRGKHIIMVFETMSTCLYDLLSARNDEPGFPLGVVKCITREVLLGLQELHKAGLVHTDLKPENVMLGTFKPVDEEALKEHRELYVYKEIQLQYEECKITLDNGGINKNKRKRLKQKLAKLEKKVQAGLHLLTKQSTKKKEESDLYEALVYIGQSVVDTQKSHVKVVDLGTACFQVDKNDYEIGTRNYRAPECILGHRFTEKIDIWAVACMVIELINGQLIFDPDEEEESEDEFDNVMRNLVHLKQIQETLGRIPKNLQSRDFFNRKGELFEFGDVECVGLDELIREKVPDLDEADLEALRGFLTPMLQIDPKNRVDAETALKHPWLELSSVDLNETSQWIEDVQYKSEDESEEEEEEEEEEESN